MEKIILYFSIIIFSNTIGAVSGMGGGVIIKPILDRFSTDPLAAINFYSSFAVFVMAVTTTINEIRRKSINIEWSDALFLAIGSVLGGIVGDSIFSEILSILHDDRLVNLIQIILVVVSLILAIFYARPGKFMVNKKWRRPIFLCLGVFLGSLSTFLGIGGGPINVAVLIFIFKFKPKKAALYSIVSILFSQVIKLAINVPHVAELHLQVILLPVILVAAITGGMLGSNLSTRLSEKGVLIFYKLIVIFVIGLNLYNGVLILLR